MRYQERGVEAKHQRPGSRPFLRSQPATKCGSGTEILHKAKAGQLAENICLSGQWQVNSEKRQLTKKCRCKIAKACYRLTSGNLGSN
jgi:hypothetical protein